MAGGKRIAVGRDGVLVGEATVVADDPANDIAILKLKPKRPTTLFALPLARHGATLGENVFTLGYPAPEVLGPQVKMTAGLVNSTAGAEGDTRFLQMSVQVQPGNSGGPVMAWDASVVGVVDWGIDKLPDERAAQNVNYAVKTSYVRAMLEDLPDLGNYAYVRPTGDHQALVSAARKAVFMLVVTQ